jgi:hypothetical protein
MASAQSSFVSPSPSFELGNYTGEASNPYFFEMGMDRNAFAVSDMPMEPGTFTDTFNWVRIGDSQRFC